MGRECLTLTVTSIDQNNVIIPQYHNSAIKVIEQLISLARFYSLKERNSRELAEFLDGVSYLPQLLIDEKERTEDFLKCLNQLSEQFLECKLILLELESQTKQK